ncbi:sulfotransferase [Pseudooceanicola aestuarii]|uniref:sulfotransferase n=1 Tax=Pseudooceanicola aestuarii TaxID=2697319 RepID=UPI0013D4DC1B|nr:sulfotransferase [Pseudooceanicola aestuarii]
MAPRLIVHAGFHKTGTSSVQQMLRANRRPLSRALRVLLKSDMAELVAATRAYAARPQDLERALVQYEAARLFGTLAGDDPRTILLSSEDLSGHIPGRQNRLGYPAAPMLMRSLLEAATAAWGTVPETVVYFSTRAPDAWMRSCHAQHVRATRMTQSLADYTAWQRPAADLLDCVDAVAEALSDTSARILSAPLEATAESPLGPLDPLLDIAEIGPRLRARLSPLPPHNTAMPAEVLDRLMALNRSDLPRDEMRSRKEALIAQVRKG